MWLSCFTDKEHEAQQHWHTSKYGSFTGFHREDLRRKKPTAVEFRVKSHPDPNTGHLFAYLPAAVIGENLIAGQVQLVPLQQQLQLPIPIVFILLVGAKGCEREEVSQ